MVALRYRFNIDIMVTEAFHITWMVLSAVSDISTKLTSRLSANLAILLSEKVSRVEAR